MKRILFLFSFIFIVSNLEAKMPQQYVSNDLYRTSSTCESSNPANVFITTRSYDLFAINVTTSGVNNSFFQVFDGRNSTGASRAISSKYDTRTMRDWVFKIEGSSNLAVSNQGSPRACLDIIYRIK